MSKPRVRDLRRRPLSSGAGVALLLCASTSGGVEVYSPAAMALGTIPTGFSSNCTFGGSDRKTLYVAARTLLKAVPMTVPGLPD